MQCSFIQIRITLPKIFNHIYDFTCIACWEWQPIFPSTKRGWCIHTMHRCFWEQRWKKFLTQIPYPMKVTCQWGIWTSERPKMKHTLWTCPFRTPSMFQLCIRNKNKRGPSKIESHPLQVVSVTTHHFDLVLVSFPLEEGV